MNAVKSIVIIGSGNVATCLGNAFQQAGLTISGVYSPTISSAQILTDQLQTIRIHSLAEIPLNADAYLLAVKDSVIEEASNAMPLVDGIVIHCSGMTPLEVLSKHNNYGVLWPIQSITKNDTIHFKTTPFCVEGNNETTTSQLEALIKQLSDYVTLMNSEQRQYVHLASVFANNFSNHLFDLAFQIMESKGLSFDLIRPLILETANKVQYNNPTDVQTGPAKRNDQVTMRRHFDLLKNNLEWQQLYETLSKSIGKQNKG
jgi:predicted short-subunit dehydrogenase-like oxidoreductase (DUF2520 family)